METVTVFRRNRKYALALIFAFVFSGCAHRVRVVLPPVPVVVALLPAPVQPFVETLLRPSDRTVELRAQLDQLFGSADFQGATWGVKIVSLDRDEILYERNSGSLITPASNMKIVTAAAALSRLGPDFRYETKVETDGEIRNGELNGNLIVVGSGDPTISSRMQFGDPVAVFRDWASQLRAQGIRKINGSILGVDSYFDEQRTAPGWPWNDLNFPFAAEVSALQFNDNIIAVQVTATRNRKLASVRLNPQTKYLRLENHVVTRTGYSDRLTIYRKENSNTIVLRGVIGTRNRTALRFVTVHEPGGYFAAVLKETLEKSGIRVKGARRTTNEEGDFIRQNPDAYRILFTHSSLPLSEIVTEMMKNSQNLFAETLVKTVGAVSAQEGSYRAAKSAIAETLAPWGIDPADLVLEDGSGLSRYDSVTPNLLTQILVAMHKSPLFPFFYDSLPIAGVDGTLRNRMIGTPAEGNVHAKTGYITFVRALSGYIKSKDGEQLAFVMILNDFGGSRQWVEWAQDAACTQLAEFRR